MTQEEKQLLLIDLCARLPYSPFVQLMEKFDDEDSEHFREIYNLSTYDIELFNSGEISNIKPYLRPMSSMTKEEEDELCKLCTLSDCNVNADWECCGVEIIRSHPRYNTYFSMDYSAIDWLNKKMFDFRGLIPKGLAEIAPEKMYELKLPDCCLSFQNESNSVIDNTTKITVGCKIRLKANSNVILSIISDDCHGDEFECSNGSVLSLKQIEKYYDIIKIN